MDIHVALEVTVIPDTVLMGIAATARAMEHVNAVMITMAQPEAVIS